MIISAPRFQPFAAALALAALASTAAPTASLGQDWFFGQTTARDGPARGAPATASSWRVSIERAPVRAADPAWTATVAFAKVPLLVSNPIPRAPPRTINPLTGIAHALEGIASFYWQAQKTASGETFDRSGLTAAHRTLPLNTRVRVTNVVNGRSVVVRINDRGPFKANRVIDLSEAAATRLDMQRLGLIPVKIEVLSN